MACFEPDGGNVCHEVIRVERKPCGKLGLPVDVVEPSGADEAVDAGGPLGAAV